MTLTELRACRVRPHPLPKGLRWKERFTFEGQLVRLAYTGWFGVPADLRHVLCRRYIAVIGEPNNPHGFIELNEFRLNRIISPETFAVYMDAQSQYLGELGEVLGASWTDVTCDVFDYGTVVDFTRTWMKPNAPAGLWARVAREVMRGHCEAALLILKAFPLEHEGAYGPGEEAHPSGERRQNAMRRYYRRLLGVERMPGAPDYLGWMCRIERGLEGVIPAPRYNDEFDMWDEG